MGAIVYSLIKIKEIRRNPNDNNLQNRKRNRKWNRKGS